jgi:mRNA interferase MazF
MNYKFGDVLLSEVQYTDTFETKLRPVLVLFEESGNIVIAGITSNLKMKGIPLTKKDGLPKESIIKLNYIFTISEKMVRRFLLKISDEKIKLIKEEIIKKLLGSKKQCATTP